MGCGTKKIIYVIIRGNGTCLFIVIIQIVWVLVNIIGSRSHSVYNHPFKLDNHQTSRSLGAGVGFGVGCSVGDLVGSGVGADVGSGVGGGAQENPVMTTSPFQQHVWKPGWYPRDPQHAGPTAPHSSLQKCKKSGMIESPHCL